MEAQEIITELRALRADLQEIREEIRHYKGFIGGVAWLVGGLAAGLGFVGSYIKTEMFS